MFILKKGHQPGVYVPLRALFLVLDVVICMELRAGQDFENGTHKDNLNHNPEYLQHKKFLFINYGFLSKHGCNYFVVQKCFLPLI